MYLNLYLTSRSVLLTLVLGTILLDSSKQDISLVVFVCMMIWAVLDSIQSKELR